MGYADAHGHLHFSDFDADREQVLERARQAGIELLISVGANLEDSGRALAFARTHDFVFASAGIHPHDAGCADEAAFRRLETLCGDPKIVAIGEVGLDYYRDHSPRETQRNVFCRFLKMYHTVGKTLILHCRDAYDDLERLLREHQKGPYRGVMHCYSSDAGTMQRFLDLGFYISFAGALTYKKNEALREACRACPPDRLLFETDAPYLSPRSKRGKRNEPAYLIETVEMAAELHGVSAGALGEQAKINTQTVFGI